EPVQLSIVYGRQGITVENRSGSRRSSSNNGVEVQTRMKVRAKTLKTDVGAAVVDAAGVSSVAPTSGA
ncbi:hypothetical protein A2U01_0090910, partial [Trifolium medium]|nr:hypothetical protein [Trifolium medium]